MHSASSSFSPPSASTEERISQLIAALTLEEKLELIGGSGNGTKSNDRVGIPALRMADGPVGIHWWCEESTAYPASICLAATWDTNLMRRMGEAIGRDARARGVHILLGDRKSTRLNSSHYS